MDLSIVVVSYNVSELLKKCLQSLRAADSRMQETGYQKPEIIVVDNNSSDDSVKMIKSEFPEVKLIENRQNTGFSKANNQGVKVSQGDRLLFLNPDTIVEENTLFECLRYLGEHPEVGSLTCRVELPDGSLDWASHRGFPTPWVSLTYFLGLGKLFPKSKVFGQYHQTWKDFNETHEIDSNCGSFMLVPRAAGEEVGWWDEDYWWMGEDIDFNYQLRQRGWQVVYFPKVKIIHYKGASSGLKKKSQEVTKADLETKIRSTNAFYDAMKLFYQKRLAKKYPKWLQPIVFGGIGAQRGLALARLKITQQFTNLTYSSRTCV